ncbi:hypothetical protein MHYP_G00191260 [Metynnis hypsauchen]
MLGLTLSRAAPSERWGGLFPNQLVCEEANAEAEVRREPPHHRQIEIDSENMELSGVRSVIHKPKHFITCKRSEAILHSEHPNRLRLIEQD